MKTQIAKLSLKTGSGKAKLQSKMKKGKLSEIKIHLDKP